MIYQFTISIGPLMVKQFVFGGEKGGITEFWFLEDFLPLEKLTKKND